MNTAETTTPQTEPANRLCGPDGQKPLLLIVDDMPANLALLSAILRKEGAEVRSATNGRQAIDFARQTPHPDLILLDVMMPDMDGHAVLAELRQHGETRDIPVIFVTALDDQGDEGRGIAEGAADYITKPINRTVLVARAKAQLDLHRAQQLLAGQKAWLEQEVARRIGENALLNTRLKLALESAGFGIWEHDHISGRNRWEDGLCQMLGYPEGPASIEAAQALIHPEDHPQFAAEYATSVNSPTEVKIGEFRIRKHDGTWLWVEARSRVIERTPDGSPARTIGTMLDIGLRKASESQRLLAEVVFTGINDGLCITDAAQHILLVNEAFCHLSGYSRQALLGKTPALLKSGVHGAAFYQGIWSTLQQHDNWQGEITNRRSDGSLLTEWLSISVVRNPSGEITHYVGVYSELSARKAAAERIQYLSSHDTLTALPNLNLFADRLEQSLISARRYERGTALLLLDLDDFHRVNDELGPAVGDEILIEIGRRLTLQARAGDTIGRRGGNEFGFVMANLVQQRSASALAQRLLAEIGKPIEINGHAVTVTASIGIGIAPENGDSGDVLIECASAALLRAKQAGSNTFRFFSPQMDADAVRRLALETRLAKALERNELSVHYQPQISLDSGRMIGMEALLRWHNPDFGHISPNEFIPIAEDTGLLIPIGEWVLRTACRQTREWLDLGLQTLRVAVNLSSRQFYHINLFNTLSEALADSRLPAGALELEITESTVISDVDEAMVICRRIKSLGVKLALDDFGTGYSSLAYLSRFPFDKIKIDQHFVEDIIENPINAGMATAAIVMARSLNLAVLAEGVETEAQAAFLRGRRCDAMQGFLFSRPLPAEEFGPLLLRNKHLPQQESSCNGAQKLLLVDDEPNVLSSLSRLLRREGYATVTATGPGEAFQILAREPIQVIISDQRMQEMSGTEFLMQVRQRYPDTIRLVLTGYNELEPVTAAINRGDIYKFLSKPWDDDQLREHIREAFRMAKHSANMATMRGTS
ncbi:MAG: EAL domain-containing protein [Rhodocyclales bacterium GT-UBC]|nr:MAG: EAL domain-containing protein [Rhodocyclales bacterium GT-UBC]